MRLDAAALRYLGDDDFRILTAVEMGMRNHELVPTALISAISGLKHGGSMRALKNVHKHKLVHRESKRYLGYRLTSLGYDFLALRALSKRGVVDAVGRQLGVGKEADVVLVSPSEALLEECPEFAASLEVWGDQPMVAMKLHRLGRTSFRAVKAKRDYLQHRKSASWIYFSRLAAVKEYAFMCALHDRGFPVPRPLGQSRHVVVMELVDGVPLNQVAELQNPADVAAVIIDIIVRLAQHGLVHCDLNEFNVMVSADERVTVIDFPQMVSTRHVDAKELYDRDQGGVVRFFGHRFGVPPEDIRTVPFEEAVVDDEEHDQTRSTEGGPGSKAGRDSGSGHGEEENLAQANTTTGSEPKPCSVQSSPFPSKHARTKRIDVLLAASGFQTFVSAVGGSCGTDSEGQLGSAFENIEDLRCDLQGIDLSTLALPSEDPENTELQDSQQRSQDLKVLVGSTENKKVPDNTEENCSGFILDTDVVKSDVVAGTLATDGSDLSKQRQSVQSLSVAAVETRLRGYDDDDKCTMASNYSVGASRMDQAKIAERVRKQRANKAQRQHLSRRNTVKDAEKRKVRVEIEGNSIWS